MQLLVIVLNKTEFLDSLLAILAELGITGATIINSEGMAHALYMEIPIFAGLRNIMGEIREQNKTIFALIDNNKIIKDLNKILKQEGIDFTESGTGIMFTLPVDDVIK